jgi:hypothetical protein
MSQFSNGSDGWRDLFDGKTLYGWRCYRGGEIRQGWTVVDGILTHHPKGGGGDIITVEQFDDFELSIDWNISVGGNSGIFYRAGEETDQIWQNALEVQVLDDAAHGFSADHIQSAGGLYVLYPPIDKQINPPGEWNQTRVVLNGNHGEHWLNGRRILSFEIGSDDWNKRVAASKFAEYPTFATHRRGHIGLQDHGDHVQYRNIRIRPLNKG